MGSIILLARLLLGSVGLATVVASLFFLYVPDSIPDIHLFMELWSPLAYGGGVVAFFSLLFFPHFLRTTGLILFLAALPTVIQMFLVSVGEHWIGFFFVFTWWLSSGLALMALALAMDFRKENKYAEHMLVRSH